jgi:hypothetical protein
MVARAIVFQDRPQVLVGPEILRAAGVTSLPVDGDLPGLALPLQPQRGARGKRELRGVALVAAGHGGPAVFVLGDRQRLRRLAALDDAFGLVAAAEVVILRDAPVLLRVEHDRGVRVDVVLPGDRLLVLGPVVALEEDVEVMPPLVVVTRSSCGRPIRGTGPSSPRSRTAP